MKLFSIFIPFFCAFTSLFAQYQIIDANGASLSFNQPPERVACITPSVTELIFAIGAGEKLLANSRYCRFPQKAVEKIKIGGYLDPDFEKIAQISPDLFILSRSKNDIFTSKLDKFKISHLALYEDGLENILKNIKILGEVFQKQENASALILDIKNAISQAKAKNIKGKPAILLFGQMAAGKGSYVGQLLDIVGAKNIMANSSSPWLVPEKEHILLSAPEVIILESKSDEAFKEQVASLRADPIWAKSPAVQNNKIYPINSDLISIPCSHIIGAIARLSEIMTQAQE